MEESLIQKLDRCLLAGNPILFTGAGFSLGATNGNGEQIPSGRLLKERILTDLLGYSKDEPEFTDLVSNTLSDICTFAESEDSPLKVQDFIISFFTDCEPTDFQRIIASFSNWKKIYTINIDDLFENAAPKGSLIVQNMGRQLSYTRANQKEYIKLHGCVRNRTEKIVFSNNQYIDSMLQSTDYRFNCFAQDMLSENFIIIGTELNELNLDYYLALFANTTDKTTHGQLFFINPNPSKIFKSKISKIGGNLIEWTAEEFAAHLLDIGISVGQNNNSHKIQDFLYIKDKFDIDKNFKGYKSYLYFGAHPDYRDIIFDWDFTNPEIEILYENISLYVSSGIDRRLLICFYGKSLSGKSVYLKRLGVKFNSENYAVYDFVGKKFDIKDFNNSCKKIAETNIVLLFDNASFYYSEIKNLIETFPRGKNIVVITTARTYSHNRKRYCLVSESWVKEIPITGETKSPDNVFASNIVKRLDEKGLLGKLKAKDHDERVRNISSFNDVESCLFSITSGSHFQSRQLNNYYKNEYHLGKYKNLLYQLAILHLLDIPYLPLESVSLLYQTDYSNAMEQCEDYITIYRDSNGVALRDSFLVKPLINQITSKTKIRLIKELLIVISPQVLDLDHTYWNEIASTLMKGKVLRSLLKLRNGDVKNLLSDIKPYYNENYNYWLQVGIAEQHDSEYEMALNHFRQAESMSPHSYIVRNAIARNYLRHANEIQDFKIAEEVHNEGVSLMKKLIDECEEFQVRAYSTHCLLFENVRFFKRNNIIPSTEIVSDMYEMLKYIIDKDPNGPMSKHISNIFFNFVREKQLTSSLPKMNMYDLKYLKNLLGPNSIEDIIEDFELE